MRKGCLLMSLVLGAQICRADAQQPDRPYNAPYNVTMPDRHECLKILELQRLKINSPNGIVTMNPQDVHLYRDYVAIVSWLQGFAAGRQVNDPYSAPQLAKWLFGYCRSNPTKSVFDAALQLSKALRQH